MSKSITHKVYFSNLLTGYTSFTFLSIIPRRLKWHRYYTISNYHQVRIKFHLTHLKDKYIINDIEIHNRA